MSVLSSPHKLMAIVMISAERLYPSPTQHPFFKSCYANPKYEKVKVYRLMKVLEACSLTSNPASMISLTRTI